MSNDCEFYVDPEEDEVFFGCISDREKSVSARLSQSVLRKDVNTSPKDYSVKDYSTCESTKKSIENQNENEHVDSNLYNGKKSADESDLSFKDANTTFSKTPENNQGCSNNSTVESEHNYSTPMKHKIDKTILTTPKSVVKADRDGGFLKVLSEIALVKAEVEADKKVEEEDKENKIIPEIILTEATPEKVQFVSPPKSSNSNSRRFRIIYNSPKNEDNVDNKNVIKKSAKDSFETCQNIINKSLDSNGRDNIIIKENRKSTERCNESINLIDLNDSVFSKQDEKKEAVANINDSQSKSVEIIDKKVDNSDIDIIYIGSIKGSENSESENCEETQKIENTPVEIDKKADTDKEVLALNEVNKVNVDNVEEKHEVNDLFKVVTETKNEIIAVVEESKVENTGEVCVLDKPEPQEATFKEDSISVTESNDVFLEAEENYFESIREEVENALPELKGKDLLVMENGSCDSISSEKVIKVELPITKSDPSPEITDEIRFSKEARKIVELLKKSTADDTMSTATDDTDETSFLYPENISLFDANSSVSVFPESIPSLRTTEVVEDTVAEKIANKPSETKSLRSRRSDEIAKTPKLPPKPVFANSVGKPNTVDKNYGNKMINATKQLQKFSPKIKPPMIKLTQQPYTVEKEKIDSTPVGSQTKIASIKYFSDRKMNNQTTNDLKKCVKKLPMDDKEDNKGVKETNATCSSKIPVFGYKPSKIAIPIRNTPVKTPLGKNYKNPKYKNIESPINAYINNRTTPLVQNVKPEMRKDGISKILKPQTIISSKNLQEKPVANAKLPFVEYRSATPYKIDKKPESRLPRLAPTVQKLIGPNSPTVLKHEGRFYMKDAGKKPTASTTNDSSVFVDSNEVSLLVSQSAQKSNRIK